MGGTACKKEHVMYCFDVLSAKLKGETIPRYEGEDKNEQFPLFVTWNTIRSDGSTRLRGCIGNFSPMPLASGLEEYALISALKDRRFPPISLAEMPKLECGVSLLTDFEDVEDPFDWELGTHGIHIHFEDPAYAAPPPTDSPASMSSTESASASNTTSHNDASAGLKGKLSSLTGSAKKSILGNRFGAGARPLSATYLPDVPTAQGWNKQETLDSAMRKAGYNGRITDPIRRSVRVTRYQSSKLSLTYDEWTRG
ncbi:hypothetical protein P389DRAFT_12480 [Cystobasidium minutum MCA 4210]|uniref:uncharacterized protein n=1 Tax=Cystobasidium minutum MCA 4210 TaxID=1397322 RepID=UPI0034CDB6AE|eukprot:jgi/Rhomi1/12480/CE12479_2720